MIKPSIHLACGASICQWHVGAYRMLAISSRQFGLVRLVPRVPHSYTPYSYIVLSDSILSANSLYLFFLVLSIANTTLCPHMYSINPPQGSR